ncbi:MAG TPA: hypothetical protein VFW47_01685 [Phenylobacterium sp.]|nr:hypothetical protein [Phenylobacterium sp.]
MSLALPSKRVKRASDELAHQVVGRVVRFALSVTGGLIVVAGVLIAPLPGPMGLPVVVVGLMLVLRNSFKARRQFVRFQHAHPRVVFPIRRLLRREPEVLQVFWQQTLRVERLILPRKMRFAVKSRRSFKRRPGVA